VSETEGREGTPRIGVDEWVATVGGRMEEGLLGRARQAWAGVPAVVKLAGLVVPAAFVPLATQDDFLLQVAIDTLIFMLLAVGLNVAVGFAGLLDLGYVAFFGFGAYTYAMLASDHTGLHLQAPLVLLIVAVTGTALGFLVGLPSWRLAGDYLAIVTLFFLQIFATILVNGDRITLPFLEEEIARLDGGLTRGPNGISNLDPMSWLGWRLESLTQYFYLALIAFALVLLALHFLNDSRVGRAWRALREEPLAAELMGMPVNWLKLLAFATGAAIAALTGTIFAAEQGAVFPSSVDVTVLITLYAMVILGGAGNLVGVTLGAVAISLALEALRTPANASWVFYIALALTLPALVRPWRWRVAAIVVGATVALGFAARAIAEAAWPSGTAGRPLGEAAIDEWVSSWVLLQRNPSPEVPTALGKIAFVALVASVLAITVLRGWRRLAALCPTIYLASCVWENVLVPQSAVTRYIILGALLVGMMAARPHGLLGTRRVEIV
jgi:branched-chain amino acid transport system permease protein